MAIAELPTLLSLDQYAEIVGINPFHFNQVLCTAFPAPSECESIWFQHGWHSPGKASREDLARAISLAEQIIARYLGYWPAPKFISDERHAYPRRRFTYTDSGWMFPPLALNDNRKMIHLDWGYLDGAGRRCITEIDPAAAVTLDNLDDDSFDEWTTVTVTVPAGTLPADIAVFATGDTSEQRQIRNLRVTITGTTAVIAGWSAQFVDPALQVLGQELDGDDTAIYLDEVYVGLLSVCKESNAYAAAVFGWQRPSEAVNFETGYGTLQFMNSKAGLAAPCYAVWDATGSTWVPYGFTTVDEPHIVSVYYRAGWPLDNWGRMAPPMDRAVAALATALLNKPICGCGYAEKMIGEWQESFYPVEAGSGFNGSLAQINNPFGPRRGAWEAYRVISQTFETLDSVGL
jgi:hypothetical protein